MKCNAIKEYTRHAIVTQALHSCWQRWLVEVNNIHIRLPATAHTHALIQKLFGIFTLFTLLTILIVADDINNKP